VTNEPGGAVRPTLGAPARSVVRTGYAAFFLVGWCMLLLPSLIREIESAFGQTDAGMGVAYLLYNLAWVTGTVSTGVLAGRMPRRLLMGGGPALIGIGLVVMAAGGSWPVFIGGCLVFGLGLGIIDSGMNAVFMDLFPGRQASALNRLHLWVAIGALVGPFATGRLVAAGVPWQAVLAGGAAAAVAVAIAMATRNLPPTRHARAHRDGDVRGRHRAAPRERRVPVPVVVLSIAIACYVASEMGVTAWLVRYLADAPIELATLALSLFWAGMAVGRIVTSYLAERLGSVTLAWTWSIAMGIALMAALAAPSLGLSIVLFAIAGVAAGPVYPMIMAIAGSMYRDRTSMVSSVLASAAIIGSLLYPPLMGFLSETLGLGVSMLGAALFAVGAAIFVVIGARLGVREGAGAGSAVLGTAD